MIFNGGCAIFLPRAGLRHAETGTCENELRKDGAMKGSQKTEIIKGLMQEFARDTGLEPVGDLPRRYLWTDAFAVCNFLHLYAQSGDKAYVSLALRLIDQVHEVLGRHRSDDSRRGWISGLGETEGKLHPTRGGLRIGKKLKERRPREAYDEALEWDRDGQYFHYLTRWMHALHCASCATGDTRFNQWAVELATAAQSRFVYELPSGSKSMYWKMSIDLSYPLVRSMGHHDPLDGWITYHELRTGNPELNASASSLEAEIADLEAICADKKWATGDPLGLGGLLADAFRLAQLGVYGECVREDVLEALLKDALLGLKFHAQTNDLNLPADHRLAFRELGLAIGIHAIERLDRLVDQKLRKFERGHELQYAIQSLKTYGPLADVIEGFWLDPRSRVSQTWDDHLDINTVMLATSLGSNRYLDIV